MTVEQAVLLLRTAMNADEVRLAIVPTANGEGVRVESKDGAGRWRRATPVLLPGPEETVVDLLGWLGRLREVPGPGLSSEEEEEEEVG